MSASAAGNIAFAVATVVTAVILALSVRAAGKKYPDGLFEDFEKCRQAAVRLSRGEDPYAGAAEFRAQLLAGGRPIDLDWRGWFAYPPVTLLLLAPLTSAPPEVAGMAWFAINVILLAAGIWLAAAALVPNRVAGAERSDALGAAGSRPSDAPAGASDHPAGASLGVPAPNDSDHSRSAPATHPRSQPESQPDAQRGCAERESAHPRFASGCDWAGASDQPAGASLGVPAANAPDHSRSTPATLSPVVTPDRSAWLAAAVMLAAPLIWTVRFNFFLGNTEVLLLFLTAAAAYGLRRGRDGWAGAGLGVAAAIKMFPLFLAGALLISGRVRAALVAGAVFVALSLVGVAYVGPGSAAGFLSSASIKTESPNGFAAWPHVQSLNGFLHRQWVPNTANRLFPPTADHADWVPLLSGAWTAAVLAAWLLIELRRRGQSAPMGLAFAVATLLVANPTNESYYSTALLLAMPALAAALADRLPRQGMVLLAATLAGLYLIGLRPGDWTTELAAAPFENAWLNNLAISRIWLGNVVLWACLAHLRLADAASLMLVRQSAKGGA